MTPQKPPLSARLNRFWANMLTPINAYLGTALIILVLAMTLAGLTGGQMGGHVEISVMRDGGDVSVRMSEDRMQDGQMPEDRMQNGREYHGREYHSWNHHGYEHHGWRHYGGGHPHGWGAGLFGLVLAVGLAALTGLVARLIQIEGHLAAIRQAMEAGSVAPAVSAASELSAKRARKVKAKAKAKAKKKTKPPETGQTKRRG